MSDRQPEEIAKVVELAAVDSEASTPIDDAWRARSNAQWQELYTDRLPAVRIAVAVLYKSKEELIDLFDKVDNETAIR